MRTAVRLDPNPLTGDYRYELSDGRHLELSLRDVEIYTERELLLAHGVELSRERLPVVRYGATIGTLPRSFDWRSERPTSPYVDLRPGDFVLRSGPVGDWWEATRTLSSWDLDAIPSFRRL